jgi:hypothetical protein
MHYGEFRKDLYCRKGIKAISDFLSEHMALKQYIRSQLVVFVKGKILSSISEWKVLCLHQDSCGALAEELEDWQVSRFRIWRLAIF